MISLYIASVCDSLDSREIYPELRRKEIEGVSSEQLKMQKLSSWKLLEKALSDSFGYTMQELKFCKNSYGKWECDRVYFSLSHTQEMVAVALSDKPVGVDIENARAFEKRRVEKLSKKILCAGENAKGSSDLLKFWTQKESIYKCFGGSSFVPDKIRVEEYPVHTTEYGEYLLSVCGDKYDLADICLKILKL